MNQKSLEERKKIIIPRITQLDANELDKEVHKVFYNQLMGIMKFLKPGTLNNVQEEINLLLNLIIYKYALVSKGATFGQELLSLKYANPLNKIQIIFYALLKYIFPYLKKKYEDCGNRENSATISKITHTVEIVVKASHLLNLLIFLKEGKYPTVTDRLLKLKYVPGDKFNRSARYSPMTRQLLWHGFMELLTSIMPYVDYSVIKSKVKRFFVINKIENKQIKHIDHNIKTKCIICNDFPVTPCMISQYCSHLACYYCLKSNILSNKKFHCPECNEPNTVAECFIFL